MNEPTVTNPEIRIPPAVHLELVQLAHAVALKRAELENAQLRQELAVRRAVQALGAVGEKVTIDLDAGTIRIANTEAPT